MSGKPRMMTGADLAARPPVFTELQTTGSEDPEEVRRQIAAWSNQNGPHTHVLLWCGPHIITTTGEPTTVVIDRRKFVAPCVGPSADIVPTTPEHWKQRILADQLPFMSYCWMPLIYATGCDEDRAWLVRMKKLGITRQVQARSGTKKVAS
jgi:hypothetical protein